MNLYSLDFFRKMWVCSEKKSVPASWDDQFVMTGKYWGGGVGGGVLLAPSCPAPK